MMDERLPQCFFVDTLFPFFQDLFATVLFLLNVTSLALKFTPIHSIQLKFTHLKALDLTTHGMNDALIMKDYIDLYSRFKITQPNQSIFM